MRNLLVNHLVHCSDSFKRLDAGPTPLDGQNLKIMREDAMTELVRELRAFGDRYFSDRHDAYMKIHKAWVRACDDYSKMSANTAAVKVEAARVKRDELKALLDAEMLELLRGRAVEEYTRILPSINDAVIEGNLVALDSCLRWAKGVEHWAWAYFG